MDLFWQHQGNGGLVVWYMNGINQIGADNLNPAQVVDTSWKIVGTGDVDQDGDADVYWQNGATGQLSVWTMNGVQMLSGDLLVPDNAGDVNWRVRAVADINMDGKPDLVWQHETQGWTAVWTMDGRQRIEGHLLAPEAVADLQWRIVGTGDLDHDGYTDLIWQHQTSGDLAWWRLNGNVQVSGAALSPGNVSDTQWKIRGSGDLDGDGHTDLLWQHEGNGSMSAWFMTGTLLRSGELLNPPAIGDLLWWIVGPK